MNNGYYGTPVFPNSNQSVIPSTGAVPNQQSIPSYEQTQKNNDMPIIEQSYIENILRLNRGKMGKFYITVPGSEDWQDKIFTGIIEQAGRDHIIVSNPTNGEWYLIPIIYLDYVTFDEPINYIKDFGLPN